MAKQRAPNKVQRNSGFGLTVTHLDFFPVWAQPDTGSLTRAANHSA
jgi:hypothetical protein